MRNLQRVMHTPRCDNQRLHGTRYTFIFIPTYFELCSHRDERMHGHIENGNTTRKLPFLLLLLFSLSWQRCTPPHQRLLCYGGMCRTNIYDKILQYSWCVELQQQLTHNWKYMAHNLFSSMLFAVRHLPHVGWIMSRHRRHHGNNDDKWYLHIVRSCDVYTIIQQPQPQLHRPTTRIYVTICLAVQHTPVSAMTPTSASPLLRLMKCFQNVIKWISLFYPNKCNQCVCACACVRMCVCDFVHKTILYCPLLACHLILFWFNVQKHSWQINFSKIFENQRWKVNSFCFIVLNIYGSLLFFNPFNRICNDGEHNDRFYALYQMPSGLLNSWQI